MAANGRGILLLVVAFMLGIGILKASEDGIGSIPNVEAGGITTTTTAPQSASTEPPAVTIPPPRPPAEVKVLPVNASGVAGVGGKTGDKLRAAGFSNTLAAVNSTSDTPSATTTVEFGPNAGADALVVAHVLGLQPTAVKPLVSPPVDDTRDAEVVVLIGGDLATILGSTTDSTTTTAED